MGKTGRAVLVGTEGVVCGLGLARLLAEAAFWSLPYTSWVAAGSVSLVGAALALGAWLVSSHAGASTDAHWSTLAPLVLPHLYVVGIVSGPLAGGALLVGGVGLTVIMMWRDRPSWFLPALLGATVLSLYLGTLLPSIGEADTLEFQVVASQLGVAHPTGYPLYVLLAKVFTLLPLRTVAWRVNFASAVFGSGAVVALYGILRRVTRPRNAVQSVPHETEGGRSARTGPASLGVFTSFLMALAFGLSPTFWSQAIAAEVYTLHNLMVALILWLLLDGGASPVRRWHGVLLLLGLGLTNHLTTALLVPAFFVALAWDRPSLQARDWLTGVGLFALGLSLYLFIPLRWPALHDGTAMTLQEFLRYISGGQFHGALRLSGLQDPTRWRIVGRLLLEPFGWVGVGLATLGVFAWAFRRRRALLVTGVTFVAFVAYGLVYYVADVAVFLLPAHLIMALWMGSGALLLARWFISVLSRGMSAYAWRPCLVALLALVPLSQLWSHLPAVDRSRERGGYDWGRYVLRQPLAQNSAVLVDTKKFAPLYYLREVEGVRRDIDIVLLGTEELYRAEMRRRLGEGEVVYLARYLPDLGGLYLRSVGPLAEVRREAPGETNVVGDGLANLGDRVHLLEADVEGDPFGRSLYHVTLHWWAGKAVDGDFVVRLRLVDARGEARWTSDGTRPVNGLFPTNAWPVDAPVSDYHEIPIQPWMPPGIYTLQVGLFRPFGGKGLGRAGGSGAWVSLGDVEVEPPSEPQHLSRRHRLNLGGGVWLTGSDVPKEAGAGASLTVDLAWRGVAGAEDVKLSWVDARGGSSPAGRDSLAAGMVQSRHSVSAPGEPGLYTLHVGLVGAEARCGWLALPRGSCPLRSVNVVSGGGGLANFGNRVLLVSAEVEEEEAAPGGVIPVALRWRGLREMETNYTVFIHLVGPDGRLHGQADSWPVQGSYPTSQWEPRREVVDEYKVRLDSDAPPGAYRTEVGLYDLETMDRLQVMNAAGAPVADSFVAGHFTVKE